MKYKMTLNEVKNFLNQNCRYRKSDMRSIKNITEMAKECMLTLTKNGTDDYSLSEDFAIILFMYRYFFR